MQTPGEILKQQRKSLGKTIFEVSQETKILEKHLKLIEANEFEKFDSPVFARGFTKIYSQYLGLDENKILALFRRENKEIVVKQKKKVKTLDLRSYITTSNITITVIAVFFVMLSIYLFSLYFNFQKEPSFTIYTPINGYESTNEMINIEGIVGNNTQLFINDNPITIENNKFNYEVKLQQGENIIKVRGVNKKNEKKTQEQFISVKYTLINQTETQIPENIQKEYKAKLVIKNSSTWIKLIIDDTQIYAQVLKSGFTKTFTVKKNIEFVSGKPDNTSLYIDNEEKALKVNTQTGIASLECKIEENILNCNN